MPTYLTIGYGDQAGYDRTPQDLRDQAHAHDARLVDAGAITGILETPVQVRNHQGSGVSRTDGAYARTELPVAGFSLIEAESLDEAVAKVANSPCAIADGVVEIWPVGQTVGPS